jgi:hypothetical protein
MYSQIQTFEIFLTDVFRKQISELVEKRNEIKELQRTAKNKTKI